MPSLPPFNILNHLDQLQPDGGSHGKHEGTYHCPACWARNFKINLKTGQYGSYGCHCAETKAGKQKIRDAVAPLEWKKPPRARQTRTWVYCDRDGKPLIKIHRQDDGEGGRRIWQTALQKGEPGDLKIYARPYRYQECLEAIEQGQKIFWVEGETCADALWGIGIPATTTLGGTNNYHSKQYRDLFPAQSLVICPDRDQKGLEYVEAIAADYPGAQWCYAFPGSFLWNRVQKDGGADIADWIEEGATAEDILAAVGKKRQFSPSTETVKTSKRPGTEKPNRFKRTYLQIEQLWGKDLRFNEFTKCVELYGEPIDLAHLMVTLALDANLEVRLERLEVILTHLAKKHCYHPVREYLLHCHQQHSDTSILDKLAERLFGCRSAIYNTFLKRTLIAAVARIFEPGCKVDTVLILKGAQGARKSTCLKVLAGQDYFDDSLGAINDKDEKLKLHQTWFAEYAELDVVIRRKDISAIKAFLSSSVDVVRPPYGKQAVRMERQAIIVGTTNQDEFLNDATGNRRFWVIPVQQQIDIELLRQERDQIWGAAVALYQAGEQWWLTETEERQAEKLIDEYLTADPWQSKIEAYLMEWRLPIVTVAEILNNCLEIEPRFQAKREQMRVADCLRRLGWGKTRKTHQGRRQHVWIQPDPPDQPGPTNEPKVDPPGKPGVIEDSGNAAQPVQPKTPFLEPEYEIEQQTDIQGWKETYIHTPYNNHGVLTERLLE